MMDLLVQRILFDPHYTIGKLFVDGVFECYTLEDTVREKLGLPVSKWKLPKITAVGVGRYELIINMSVRFKKLLPLLLGTLGFVGVRLHSGNTEHDTEGCILVGKNMQAGRVTDSRNAMIALQAKIQAALDRKERVFITIKGLPA